MLRWVAVNGGVNLHPPKNAVFFGGDWCQNIFVTTYPMDLKIFWDIFTIFEVLKNFLGSCRNFYHPVLNPQTRSFLCKCAFLGAENDKNGSWDKKSIFSKSKISIHQSNHGKRNIKPMLVRAYKRFRATWGVCKIIVKFQFLPSINFFLWDFPREVFFGRAKNWKFWIIAETTQVVLKCF